MPLFSVLLVPMIGATAAAVDYAVWLERKAHLQSVADISALAGARAFIDGDDEHALAQANQWIDGNLALDAERRVEIVESGKIVEVGLAMDAQPILSGMLSSDGARIGVTAAAYANDDGPYCILALNPTADDAIFVDGHAKLEAEGCTLWSNSDSPWSFHSKGNSETTAERICVVGEAEPGGTVNADKIDEGCAVKDDPFAGWDPPPTLGSCVEEPVSVNGDQITLEPGVYCHGVFEFTFAGGDEVHLEPGVYVIYDHSFKLRGSAKVSGEDVGIYLTGYDARLDFAGNAQLDITADSEGDMAGLAIARDRNAPDGDESYIDLESTLTGNFELSIRGATYMPNHTFRFWGNNNTHAQASQIVADRIEVGGHGKLTLMADDEGSDFAPTLQSIEMVRLIK